MSDQTTNDPRPRERAPESHEIREAELQLTGHAPVATQFAGWGPVLPTHAQGGGESADPNPGTSSSKRSDQ